MSPGSSQGSGSRRAWRIISSLALVASGAAILLSVLLYKKTEAIICAAHHDKVHRLENLNDYLDGPAGREPTVFNQYIRRVSLPQTRREVDQEKRTLPAACTRVRSVRH